MNGNPKFLTYFIIFLIVAVVLVGAIMTGTIIYKKATNGGSALTGDSEVNSCLSIQNSNIKRMCIESIAATRKDADVCKNLSVTGTENTKNGNYMTCFLTMAVAFESQDICNTNFTGNTKEWCLSKIAAKTKNASICNGLTKLSYKNQCYYNLAIAAKNSTYCDKIVETKDDTTSTVKTIDWTGSIAKCKASIK